MKISSTPGAVVAKVTTIPTTAPGVDDIFMIGSAIYAGVSNRNAGDPTSGIFKSVNDGASWNGLMGGFSPLLVRTQIARVAMAYAKSNTNIMYAFFSDPNGDIFTAAKT